MVHIAKLKESQKLILGLVGVGGAIGLGYVVITRLFPGATSAQCTTPGSACYSALQPYIQDYNTCAQQYASNLQAYLQEDNSNGTGLTQAQINNLNYLTNCMNNAANNIAKIAQQYNVDWASVVESLGTELIAGALILIGIKYLGPELATVVRSGATAASNMIQSIIRGSVSNGTITANSASALADSLPTVNDAIQAYDQDLLTTLSEEGVTTAEEAATIISEDSVNIAVDFAVTIEDLASLG